MPFLASRIGIYKRISVPLNHGVLLNCILYDSKKVQAGIIPLH
jgi:hypothetical protein